MRPRINLPVLPSLPAIPGLTLHAGLAGAAMLVLLYQMHKLGSRPSFRATASLRDDTAPDQQHDYVIDTSNPPVKRNAILRATGNTIKGFGLFGAMASAGVFCAGAKLAGDTTTTTPRPV